LNLRLSSFETSADIQWNERVTKWVYYCEASDEIFSAKLIHLVCRCSGPTDRSFEKTGLAVHDPDRTPLRKHFGEHVSCKRSFSRSRAPLYEPMTSSVFES